MNNTHPPKILLQLLKWFCKSSYHIDIEGDLLELHERNVLKHGRKKANQVLLKDVLMLFRPGIVRSVSNLNPLTRMSIYNNYFKVSRRNLMRQKQYAFINIIGLTVGITCFILISLYVQHERSFDRFYDDVDSIYHVYDYDKGNVYLGNDLDAVTPAQLAHTLMENYPEVNHATTVSEDSGLLGDEKIGFYWEKGLFTDPYFFEVFSHPKFIQGDAETAFELPESMILTKSLAIKVFRDENVIGETLVYNDKSYTVTGVIENHSKNSTFQFTFMANLQADQRYLDEFKKAKWDGSNYYTFFNTVPSADLQALQDKMPALIDQYWTDGRPFEFEYLFQPFSAMHFRTDMNHGFEFQGSQQQINLFVTIAILILALACINYMNLSIARSINRAKEVGLRKAIGAEKKQLIIQFLLESVMLSFLALFIALGLVWLVLPEFGSLLNRELDFNLLDKPELIFGIIGMVTILGIVSGSYPAFGMSSLDPIHVLKGNASGQAKGSSLQRWLIVGQYAVSTVMVICTMIMYQQFQFIGDQELGFDQDQIITMQVRDPQLIRNFESMHSEWSTNPNILAIGTSQNLPHDVRSSTIVNDDEGGDPNDDFAIYRLRVNHEFLDVYGLELIAGTTLPTGLGQKMCLINESTAEALGLSAEQAVGQILSDDSPQNARTIVGVVKNFHSHALHLAISPVLIEIKPYFEYISVKAQAGNTRQLIAFMEGSWKQHTNYPFEFQFMDERVNQLYKADQQ